MILFQLFSNPGLVIVWLSALIVAITAHEFSHGLAARFLGDDTAERAGRLTLNPLAHLDLLGSVMLLLVGFGWAKPVPINPASLQKGKLGRFLVSFAGIGANLLLAIIFILLLKLVFLGTGFGAENYLIKFLVFLIYINVALFVFNLFPIAPLDGYRIFESFAPIAFRRVAPFLEQWGFLILIAVVFLTDIIGSLIVFVIRIFSVLSGINLLGLI
ncbi:MAG TPA: site-2 protease family protein [Candidatus Paceibacterota bacterium]